MSALIRRGAPVLAAVLAFAGVGIASAIESGPKSFCVTATGRTIALPKNDTPKGRFCAPSRTRSERR
jgi:hypothetical protein